MKRIVFVLAILVLFIGVVPAFAQEGIEEPTINCMPENAPLTTSGSYSQQYATITVLRDGVQAEQEYSNYVTYYRLSSVVETGTVCAVSGWMVQDYANDTPDFSNASQFQLLITSDQIVLSVSNLFFMNEFGFYPNNNDGGVTFMLARNDDSSFTISEIHTSVAQLSVIAPNVAIRFESVTQ